MKTILIALVAVLCLACCADVSEAACGRGLFGIRGRRAEGRGLFQGNGPVKRAFGGGRGAGGCG